MGRVCQDRTTRLGIVAGGGTLPQRLIEVCRATGREVFVLALEGQTPPQTVAGVPHAWIPFEALSRSLQVLRDHEVGELVFAGPVRRPSLRALIADPRVAGFLARVGVRALGDDGLMSAMVRELEDREGFRVIGPEAILGDLLAPEGVFGAVAPDAVARGDILRGVDVVRALGAVDVGQAAVVQQGQVLGVEAAEGTDALMQRCAALRRDGPGPVLVKLPKPSQERRVDLPTIGVETVRAAAAAGLRGIAVEAGGTLVVDRAAVVAAADAAGLFVVGIAPPT